MKWHDASEELPKKSGKYFVQIDDNPLKFVPYSTKYQAFNVEDYFEEDEAEWCKMDVDCWAEFPPEED